MSIDPYKKLYELAADQAATSLGFTLENVTVKQTKDEIVLKVDVRGTHGGSVIRHPDIKEAMSKKLTEMGYVVNRTADTYFMYGGFIGMEAVTFYLKRD